MTKRRHEAIEAVRILSQGLELMTASTEALDRLIDEAPKASPIATTGGRIASVDALRGLTILLMIFVNDLGPAAPSWMHHIQPPNADGMTLADVVFPAFLFIVGVSIPLAFERARRDGKSMPGPARPHPRPHRGSAVHGRDRLQQRGRRHARPAPLEPAGVRRADPGLVRRASRAHAATDRC